MPVKERLRVLSVARPSASSKLRIECARSNAWNTYRGKHDLRPVFGDESTFVGAETEVGGLLFLNSVKPKLLHVDVPFIDVDKGYQII